MGCLLTVFASPSSPVMSCILTPPSAPPRSWRPRAAASISLWCPAWTSCLTHGVCLSVLPVHARQLDPPLSAAAFLAATCRGFRAAHAESWWPAYDTETGNLLEPRSGRFWRELSPGDEVQAAVDACPKYATLLLRPGTFPLAQSPLAGLSNYGVNVFGRGLSTLEAPPGLDCAVALGTFTGQRAFALDGVTVRSAAGGKCGVQMTDGPARLQACVIIGPSLNGVKVCDFFDSYHIDDDENEYDEYFANAVIIDCRCGEYNISSWGLEKRECAPPPSPPPNFLRF